MSNPHAASHEVLPLTDARTMMKKEGDDIVGVLSSHDLDPKRLTKHASRGTVADVMSRHVMTIRGRKRADTRTAVHHRVAHRHRRGTPAW